MVGEILEPPRHEQKGRRPGNKVGNQYQDEKLPRDVRVDAKDGCSKDLAYPDLLSPLFCDERNQPDESQAGDEYGKDGKVTECPTEVNF